MRQSRPRRRRRILLTAIALPVLVVALWAAYRWSQGNFHEVVPGQVYRSAQPAPEALRKWAAEHGIRTIVNLRGERGEDAQQEQQLARELGIRLIDARCSARDLPSALWLRRIIADLETAPRPMLIHCKAGADRTGVVSVLAAMAVGGQDYPTARRQLSARYGHVDGDREHVAGLFPLYEEHCRAKGLPTDGWTQFRAWAMTEYCPGYFRVEIVAPKELTARPGTTVPVDVRIVNRAGKAIPASSPGKEFYLASFSGSSEQDSPGREFGPRFGLPARDIAPGEALELVYPLVVPEQAGEYDLHFDLVEEHRTWFARQGSPVADFRLLVRRD